MFYEESNILTYSAELECKISRTNYPEMNIISFGATIKGSHSLDERASITSTQEYWKYLLEILKKNSKEIVHK